MPKLISCHQKDQVLLDDIAARSGAAGFRVWWLGQSGYLLQYQNKHVLIDPYLSDSLTRKYLETDKPHTRMTELVVDPAKLDFVDVATSSHNHTDHLDAETLVPLLRVNPEMRIVVPEANLVFAANRLGLPESSDHLVPVDADQSHTIGPFTFHAIPAAHDELTTDEQGRHHFVGYIITFGPFAIYHSGDTRLYDGMEERLGRFDIDLAILPINGRAPERRVAGNLWGAEAAQLAHDIGAKIVTPCHYDMFTFNTEPPDQFVEMCQRLGQPYEVLTCGQKLEYPPGSNPRK